LRGRGRFGIGLGDVGVVERDRGVAARVGAAGAGATTARARAVFSTAREVRGCGHGAGMDARVDVAAAGRTGGRGGDAAVVETVRVAIRASGALATLVHLAEGDVRVAVLVRAAAETLAIRRARRASLARLARLARASLARLATLALRSLHPKKHALLTRVIPLELPKFVDQRLEIAGTTTS